MATATTARPSNPLRARRDGPRLNHVSTKRAAPTDTNGETSAKRRKLEEPYVKTQDFYLKKFAGKQPSLVIHLHQNYFKFDGQDGSFPLDSPMKFFLAHLRNRTVPHQMIEELFLNNVPFYDGCLIVEVHNHRQENGKDKARTETAAGDQVRYSMHNYTSYITPSPFVPYPKKAAETEAVDRAEAEAAESSEKSKPKGKGKEGPRIVTLVLEPTELSRHAEIELLARTPASEMRSAKRSADGATPGGGQPPTPHLSVPPTPLIGTSRSSPGQESKMCLEPVDLYQFQAEILLMTEPPLLLEPLNNHKALDVLAHPLHSAAPPSPKTRRRTTAEMAADDAQAAEAERRMLIMDERLKPSARSGAGTNTGDNAGAASTLGFSRFKTLTMVRERLEEQDRLKKDEEAQAAAQRKAQEEANAAQQQRMAAQAEGQRKLMNQRQQQARQQALQEQRNQQALQAQQAAMMQHAQSHSQQNGMMMNQQQLNFQQQQQASMAQASPVVRNQTPMMQNSSPMMQQNGFPMTTTSSQQGIGSPQRPTSAAIPNGNLMARQVSQQQHASRNGTPQMQQGTPNMAGVMPNGNRQVSQTPRMPLASPGPGTPGGINMQTPQQTGMTPEQWSLLQAQRQHMAASQGGAMQAGSPGQNIGQMAMTAEQIQNIRQQHALRQQQLLAQAQGAGQFNPNDPRHAAMMAQRQAMMVQQQQQAQMRQRMLQQQQQQQQGMPQQQLNVGQAGSPGVMQGTQNMNQGQHQQQNGVSNTAVNGDGTQNNPQQQQQQQLTPQQQQHRAMQIRSAQAQLQQLSAQYNGYQNIPQNIVAALPPAAQSLLRGQHARQQAARTQAMAMKAQQAQSAGQAVVGTSGGNPEYMATLRNHQAFLAMQQGGMGSGGGQQGQFGGGQGGDQLAPHFAAMQHSLQRGSGGQQGGMQ